MQSIVYMLGLSLNFTQTAVSFESNCILSPYSHKIRSWNSDLDYSRELVVLLCEEDAM